MSSDKVDFVNGLMNILLNDFVNERKTDLKFASVSDFKNGAEKDTKIGRKIEGKMDGKIDLKNNLTTDKQSHTGNTTLSKVEF